MNPAQKAPPQKPPRSLPRTVPGTLAGRPPGYASLSNSDVQISVGSGVDARSSISTNPFDDDTPFELQIETQQTSASTHTSGSSNPFAENNSSSNETALESGSGRSMNKRRMQLRSLIGSARTDGTLEEKQEITTVDVYDDLTIIRFLTNERVYGYPGSKGTFTSNFYRFVLNSHPFLSIFCVHPLHPFTKMKRFIVFLCSFASIPCTLLVFF